MGGFFFSHGQSIALFGGSFDPPHDGHRRIAEAALKALHVDFVWWLVSPQNPLKNHPASKLSTRLEATRKLAAHPKFIVSDEETQLGTRFAIDTVRALKSRHQQVNFIWLIGADNLAQLHQWHDWQGLMRDVPIAVYPRPHDTTKAMFSAAAHRFAPYRLDARDAALLKHQTAPAWVLLDGKQSDLSSTDLRKTPKSC